jgi:hypothetical protein
MRAHLPKQRSAHTLAAVLREHIELLEMEPIAKGLDQRETDRCRACPSDPKEAASLGPLQSLEGRNVRRETCRRWNREEKRGRLALDVL